MVEPVVYALALVPAVLWGFSPILSKRGMAGGGSSLQATLVVVIVDSTVYWGALLILGGIGALLALEPAVVGVFLAGGVLGTALGRLASFAGVDRVGASINSAGISTRPLFATALALGLLGETVGVLTWLGVATLVAGLIVLTLSKGGDLGGWRPRDLFFPLAASLAFAVGSVIRRFGLTTTDATVLQAVAINEVGALVVLGGYGVLADRGDIFTAPRRTYGYFVGSGLLTAVALFALFAALQRGRVAIVDSLGGTAPLFTTVFAAVLLRDLERVTRGIVAGALLIVVGAAVITLTTA